MICDTITLYTLYVCVTRRRDLVIQGALHIESGWIIRPVSYKIILLCLYLLLSGWIMDHFPTEISVN